MRSRRWCVPRLGGLVLMVLGCGVPAVARAGDVGRYRFSCRSDAVTFVLDTESGRVWRYDRGDDAWYLYDLEALVGKSAQGKRSEPPPANAEEPAAPPGE